MVKQRSSYKQIQQIEREIFGYDSLRPGQQEVIAALD
ncbi:hypothetical protein NIES4071_59180 [Calothrix sp. NIES-4071]|nr:hypothetical protein NIES4071_59180 [Calothrix sp. NIES-4071]BAZ60225.1 hypothetical protein NIES4105_59130 [Calothrix sp. NIES-4105]